jgi:hypothetical protein
MDPLTMLLIAGTVGDVLASVGSIFGAAGARETGLEQIESQLVQGQKEADLATAGAELQLAQDLATIEAQRKGLTRDFMRSTSGFIAGSAARGITGGEGSTTDVVLEAAGTEYIEQQEFLDQTSQFAQEGFDLRLANIELGLENLSIEAEFAKEGLQTQFASTVLSEGFNILNSVMTSSFSNRQLTGEGFLPDDFFSNFMTKKKTGSSKPPSFATGPNPF